MKRISTGENTKKKQGQPFGENRRKAVLSVVMLALSFVIMFVVLAAVATPEQHDIRVGEPASETIKATKDIEDKIATEKLRQQASASLGEDIMRKDATVTELSQSLLDDYLTSMRRARTGYQKAILPTPTPTPTPVDEQGVPLDLPQDALPAPTVMPTATPNPMDTYTQMLTSSIGALNLTQRELRAVLLADDTSFESMAEIVRQILLNAMDSGVREGALQSTLQNLTIQLYGQGIESQLLPGGIALLTGSLRENVFIDEEATQAEKEQLAAAVDQVIYQKGQNIVQAGEVVTEQQYAMLSELGLLQSEGSDLFMYLGLGLMLGILFAMVLMYLMQFERDVIQTPKMALLLCLICLIQLFIGLAMRELNTYLIPMQLTAILIAILLKPGLAILMNMVMGFCIGVLATGDEGLFTIPMFKMLLLTFIVGSFAVYVTKYTSRRSRLLYAGFLFGAISFACVFATDVMINTDLQDAFYAGLYAAGGGLISAVLAVGLLPLLESMFNLVTPQMLLELSTPTQPLLRQLQTEAPGTYHHSIMVANLAEAAADKVNANALLCRVGAYYHDVGKTRRPIFFKENQLDQPNPHDGMEPEVSAAILAAHVRDGLSMMEKYKMPRAIMDLVAQHHGDTPMAYFLYKAQQQAKESGKEVDASVFHYDGPKPQSKEAAILMLADTVEAAVRTLKDRSVESITAFVHKLVSEKLAAAQFDDAPVTLRDLGQIESAFVKTLAGIYHERIEYPSSLEQVKKPNG